MPTSLRVLESANTSLDSLKEEKGKDRDRRAGEQVFTACQPFRGVETPYNVV